MTITASQQVSLDNALEPLEKRVKIGKCNLRINPAKTQKESTYQVVLDALALTTYYPIFLITADVPEIYMHQFWFFINKHGSSYRFKGMYYKKNVDFVELLWEDFVFQIDNRDTKTQEKMYYPRFTKAVIYHFITKDKTISMRNKLFMHTAQDDCVLSTMRFVSKSEDFQVYGALLPEVMTNQKMRNSRAYNTYLAYATRAATPKKARKFKKPTSPSKKRTLVTLEEEKPEPAKKFTLTKKSSRK
ncbi:hypothetical protein Tco_0589982 [Tanacetum coccineum]